MKVLFLINGLGAGGTERSLVELLPYALERGIEPLIAYRDQCDEGVESIVRALGVRLHRLPGRGRLGPVLALRRMLREERPDLVHTMIFDSDIRGRLAAAGLPIPVLTSLVNTSYEPVRLLDPRIRRSRLALARMLDGWTARHLTDHFHAVTEAVKHSAVRHLGLAPERITVVPRGRNALRLGRPSPDRRLHARRRFRLGEGERVIVTVGRQEFQKGQGYLLRAFAEVARKLPEARLVLAGRRGNASDELDGLVAELGLAERVVFTGHLDDVEELLAAADLFVFPSLYEGMGGAAMEAMALALPIVASDLEALREMLEPGGNCVMVPPADAGALAAALRTMLADPDRMAAFGRRSLEIFEQHFTLDRVAGRMIDLFAAVARGTAGAPAP